MNAPSGSIQGLCSSSATIFSIGIAFLGFWAYGAHSGEIPWTRAHLLVIFPAFVSYYCLAAVPVIATRVEGDECQHIMCAQNIYIIGVGSLFVALVISFII